MSLPSPNFLLRLLAGALVLAAGSPHAFGAWPQKIHFQRNCSKLLTAKVLDFVWGKSVTFNAAANRFEVFRAEPGGPRSNDTDRYPEFDVQVYTPVSNFKTRGVPRVETFAFSELHGSNTHYYGKARSGSEQIIVKKTHFAVPRMTRVDVDLPGRDTKLGKEIQRHLNLVFERYREMLPAQVVERMREQESALDPTRTVYVVYSEPRHFHQTRMIVRLYDASPHDGIRSVIKSNLPDSQTAPFRKLPLERSFPDLVLPERAQFGSDAHLFEIGRLAASPDIKAGIKQAMQFLYPVLHQHYNGVIPEHAAIYIAALPEAAEVYAKKFGFHVVLTPETTPALRASNPPEVILRMGVSEFIDFYNRGGLAPFPVHRR